MTAKDLIANAHTEIGAVADGTALTAAQAQFGLSKLNRIFDNWNAEELFIYSSDIRDFTLTANHSPHSIGPQLADFIVPSTRPPKIEAAQLILTNQSPAVYRRLELVNDAWWLNNPVPTLATPIPMYLYYNAGWPLGQIYLWPVPGTAYGLRLLIWTALAKVSLNSGISLPPGYEDALTLTLAEDLCPSFNMEVPPGLGKKAHLARLRLKSVNSEAPTMACDGSVMSVDARPQSSIADFYSGYFRP